MSIVPCGANMGHGSSCTEGYLCDSCKRIAELQAQLKSSVEEAYDNGVRAVQDEANRSINELEAQLRDIALMAKPVAATAKNTSAVRTGHELGGYIKHYIVPTHLITAIKGEE